ncbi:sugar ABC transporter permease, partial [Agrobacterium sp. S2]|nr:sugar ABC transporter permease [Agrobacterium sp. S2]
TFYISFFSWNPIGVKEFIGFDNFTRLFADPRFWNATVNTFGIWILSTVPQLLLALTLAHLLNHARLRLANLFRMSMLVPYITSVAATAVVFAQLFDRDYGMVNWLLGSLGFSHVDFLQSRVGSWVLIAVMVMWRWFGYNTLL